MLLIKKIQELENDVAHKQGRCGQAQSCLAVYDDVQAKEVEKKMSTKAGEHPKLVIFIMDKKKVELIKIVGDGHAIDVTEMGVAGALLMLCVSYYVFEMSYPKKYNQILGLIQHKIIKEFYWPTKSQRFTELISNVAAPNVVKTKKRKSDSKMIDVSHLVSDSDEEDEDVMGLEDDPKSGNDKSKQITSKRSKKENDKRVSQKASQARNVSADNKISDESDTDDESAMNVIKKRSTENKSKAIRKGRKGTAQVISDSEDQNSSNDEESGARDKGARRSRVPKNVIYTIEPGKGKGKRARKPKTQIDV